MNSIINNGRFADIPIEHIGRALRLAASVGHLDVVNTIMVNGRFVELPIEWIIDIFENAAKKGRIDIVNAIIANRRFADIPIELICKAFANFNNNHIGEKKFSDNVRAYYMTWIQKCRIARDMIYKALSDVEKKIVDNLDYYDYLLLE